MFNDDMDLGADDFHHCTECGENFPDANHCPDCDEGRCGICCDLIDKGAEHATDGQGGVYCVSCDKLAAHEAVAEIAEKLAADSDGIPLATDLEETTPIAPMTNNEIAALDPLGVFTKEAA